MENFVSLAGQYGGLGLTLLASFWYINKKDTEYQTERNKNIEMLIDLQKQTMTAINNNTNILSEISSIIKSK